MEHAARFNVPSFLSSSFDEPVLYGPARVDQVAPCNSLKIITAFIDCERISTHFIALSEGVNEERFVKDLTVDIIVGMTKTSLSLKKHEDLCRLLFFLNGAKNMPKITCRYINAGAEVHSKIYLWGRRSADGRASEGRSAIVTPEIAFCGSLNYTMNAFYRRRESVSAVADLSELHRYYESLLQDSIDCFDPRATEKLKNRVNNTGDDACNHDSSEEEYWKYDKATPVATLHVSLLKADGSDTGYGSGINWGIRSNGLKRDRNQAYVPYNTRDRKQGFFPDRLNPTDKNCPIFRVVTKDFGSFHMRMAQQNNKALHSVESNSILGEWIRKRVGVPSGSYVTKQALESYGRTYVTFRKFGDGVYLLDF